MTKGRLEEMEEKIDKLEKDLLELRAEKVQFVPIPYPQPDCTRPYPHPQWEPYKIHWTTYGGNTCIESQTLCQSEVSNG